MNAEGAIALLAVDGSIDGRGAPSPSGRSQPTMNTQPHPVPAELLSPEQEAWRAAFDAALPGLRDELLHFMLRQVQDDETAADLAQETLSRMMKYRDDRTIRDRELMLFRIAHNVVGEHWRGHHRHRQPAHVPLDDIGPLCADEPSAETRLDARQAVDLLLNRTIANLPPKCRLAFMLNRFDGLSYMQVAAKMDISVKMVEKHITRALLACRAAVGDRDF